MADSTSSTLTFLWHLTALRISIKLDRLARAMLKAGYDPNQPRVPAGSPTGGRWVDGTPADRATARVRVAISAFDNPGLYYVDLEREDRKGGHGFSKHVGKSVGYLKAYLIAWNMNPANKLHQAEGSFHTSGEANSLSSAVLRSRPDIVWAAINGEPKPLNIRLRFDHDTGYEAFQLNETALPIIRSTYWVEVWITHDPDPKSAGYRVITAYPMNETPNETTLKDQLFMVENK